MKQFLRKFLRAVSKPILFGLCGAGGCLIAAIAGEIFLAFALPPPSIQMDRVLPKVDVMFVLDITSSMDREIQGVQQGIQSFAQELSRKQLDAQVGLIAFGDRFNGEEAQIIKFSNSVFTADMSSFSQQVGQIIRVDGGDPPESSLDALSLAAVQPFRTQAVKVILLITDAPPKIPDRSTRSIEELAQLLKTRGINQLHLVIQPSEAKIYAPLQVNNPGEIFSLSETASARQGFEKILPNLGATIAQRTIKGLQTHREFAPESATPLILVTSIWTGILALGVTISLITGQNFYLRRRLFNLVPICKGTAGSLCAGIMAGAVGQLVFAPIGSIPILLVVGRVMGWILLGSLIGGGISLGFVTNLNIKRGIQGGTIGGGVGAIGFLVVSSLWGDLTGRLLGAISIGFFIGLMVAMIEELTRKVWLVVHWNDHETTPISLGDTPVILGSSTDKAHVYLSASKGYYPETAKIFQRGAEITIEYNLDYATDKGMKQRIFSLNNGDTRKFGEIKIEIKTAQESSSLAPVRRS
jgi:Ca-activated chloride channel homolog